MSNPFNDKPDTQKGDNNEPPKPKMRFTGTIMAIAIIAVYYLLQETGILQNLQSWSRPDACLVVRPQSLRILAQVSNDAAATSRLAGNAGIAPMQNQPVVGVTFVFIRHHFQ